MNSVCRDIFKAIHEGKWLSIEYKNKNDETTKYWIGIKSLDPLWKSMKVEGLHLAAFTTTSLTIYIDSILSSHIVEGSFFASNKELIQDIRENPEKYASIFDNVANLKTLEYLSECNKLDNTPYKAEYDLIEELDADRFQNDKLALSEEQFKHIVRSFQYKAKNERNNNLHVKSLALNSISINSRQGLYVLAYRKLYLDVKERCLIAGKNILLNREFIIDRPKGKAVTKASITKFLDPADQYMLDDVEEYLEAIKDSITRYSEEVRGVDDMPYIIAIGYDVIVDLDSEYKGIRDMYSNGTVTIPVDAFFGNLTKRPLRKKTYPLALLNKQINLDQLLAINNAVKYPLTYVQGPPGTGKTKTILFTIITAFFNKKTVLFSSYNNHPIDEVVKKLRAIHYKDSVIPFPVLRIGNMSVTERSIADMKRLYELCSKVRVYDSTLDKTHGEESRNMEAFTKLMERYEELLDLKDRKEALQDVMGAKVTGGNMAFQMNMSDKQLPAIEERINEIGEITDKQALSLVPSDREEMLKFLFFTSAKLIKRLDEPKNKELKEIILCENPKDAVDPFFKYLSNDDNMKRLLRVFPVVATTCIGAHRLGDPKPYFDMTIMDEASQCNTAMSLVPIIRGENLMLVGDPQQLNPVILLDPTDNEYLRKRYNVTDEYDYISNSIYKTFLACDSVSDEILLRNHYRCAKKIIDFNNKKYYNNKLEIKSKNEAAVAESLVYINVEDNYAGDKNTAPKEAAVIVDYVEKHPDQKIGIITPFVNQKELITKELKAHGMNDNVTCGTVHAFQGDEKDVILFSLALTDQTSDKTYGWLKNNKELINVATSRARDQLVVVANDDNLERLRATGEDDIYELVDYVRSNGESQVTSVGAASRALGIKPYSSKTEEAFLTNLNHAMSNIFLSGKKCSIKKEVPISQVFQDNLDEYNGLFYTGRFDFVVYEKEGRLDYPILAIELDGKEHLDDAVVRRRDEKKNQICESHGFQLIRVENSYARRYNYIKDILSTYFDGRSKAVKVQVKRK